ncbi:MAG: hypothetical protein GC134_02605 [Proteobacteria bacterium]|nr:hypothetical protein [Pseudomonadota bacterium]
MNMKSIFTACALLLSTAAAAQAQTLPFDNVYYSPYADGAPYVAYYDQEDTSPSYYQNNGWRGDYGNYAYSGYNYPYSYGYNGYNRPFYGYYNANYRNDGNYYTYGPYTGWPTYSRYRVTEPQLFAYRTWDGVPIYYSDTYETGVPSAQPISYQAAYQPYPLPTVYNYRYIDNPTPVAYNMGTVPQRERWWLNRVIEETTTGDRISWNIDNFQYQFRADDGIYRDHNTWRACRKGTLMRRASQMDQWSMRAGDFCRTQYGDWEYVGK